MNLPKSGVDMLKSLFYFSIAIPVVLFVCCSETGSTVNPSADNSSNQQSDNVCDKYYGYWQGIKFKNIYDESKMICGNKPCEGDRGGYSFRLYCGRNKVVGRSILYPDPATGSEMSSPLSAVLENDTLNLSFTDSRKCSNKLSVKFKDNLLVGTFEQKDCKEKHKYPSPLIVPLETEEEFKEGIKGGIVMFNLEAPIDGKK
jgi:hypothetical protein